VITVPAVNDADGNNEIDPVTLATINEDQSFIVSKADLLAKALNPNATITNLVRLTVHFGQWQWHTDIHRRTMQVMHSFTYKVDGVNASAKGYYCRCRCSQHYPKQDIWDNSAQAVQQEQCHYKPHHHQLD
jgi:hypothetical protein